MDKSEITELYQFDIVRLHKEINQKNLDFRTELGHKLVARFLTDYFYEDNININSLVYDINSICKWSGYTLNNKEKFLEQIKLLQKFTNVNFKIFNHEEKEIEIAANLFSLEINHTDGKIEVFIAKPIKDFLFIKSEIDLITKAKKSQKMLPSELDEYNLKKHKFQQLFLYSFEGTMNFSSKYITRLYMLLSQFKKTGFYKKSFKEFKELLEIPKSYRPSVVQSRVLEPAKEELKKSGIVIREINYIKKGRTISTIEIKFNSSNVKETTQILELDMGKLKFELGKKIGELDDIFQEMFMEKLGKCKSVDDLKKLELALKKIKL